MAYIRNHYYLKLLCIGFIVTGIMFIFHIMDVFRWKSCSEHLTPSSAEYLLHRTHQSYMGEKHTSKKLLPHLQNSNSIENKELLLKSKMELAESDVNKNAENETDSCTPRKHIFFLKTHKTASSTIMNMLFRFGESYNLTFAFPAKDNTQFFYPGVFHSSYVEGYLKKGYESFDIMCHHMRFQLSEVEKVMPKDTFYFTIMRNPVSQMESSFSYYKKQDIFSKAESLEEFLKNTSSYYLSNSHSSNYAKNLMTFDLGFDHNGLESIKHFQLNWRAVETMFNLVLITEYFDESLVLLKDALCWSLDDVLSFPLNSRSDTTKKSLSHDTQERIKSWNQLDWQLYLYFNSSFWNRVEKFGRDRMQHEVEELRQRRSQMVETCIQGEVDPDKIQDKSLKPYQSGEARILGYNIKPGLDKGNQLLCQRLVTPELQYSKLLLKRQRQLKDNALYREKETINKSK